MMRTAVVGVAGRMGCNLVQAIRETASASLVAGTEAAGFASLRADAGELAGVGKLNVPIVAEMAETEDFDVLIDFTTPAATMQHLQYRVVYAGCAWFTVNR